MAPALLVGVLGVWLVLQATTGRLAARVLSFRQIRPGEVPAPAQQSVVDRSSSGVIPAAGRLSIDQVARVMLDEFGDPDLAAQFTAIAMRESGGNPAAHNPIPPDDSYGLLQINRLSSPQYPPSQLTDPAGNARAAHELYNAAGLRPWQIGGNPLARTDLAAARAAVARVRGS